MLKFTEWVTDGIAPIAEAMPTMLWIGDQNGGCVT